MWNCGIAITRSCRLICAVIAVSWNNSHAVKLPGLEIRVRNTVHIPGSRVDLPDILAQRLTAKPRPVCHTLGLGGLYECPCINSSVRENFENKICESLLNISVGSSQVSYLSLGCGGLFPDLLILRKVLLAGKVIRAVLVDSIFQSFIDGLKTVEEDLLDPIEKLPIVELPWIGESMVSGRQQPRFPRFSTSDLVANFVGWLNWRAEKSARIYVFGSLDGYLQYTESTGQLIPDLAVGCDLPVSVIARARQSVPRLICLHCSSESKSMECRSRPLKFT
jgi:hypothetical protein